MPKAFPGDDDEEEGAGFGRSFRVAVRSAGREAVAVAGHPMVFLDATFPHGGGIVGGGSDGRYAGQAGRTKHGPWGRTCSIRHRLDGAVTRLRCRGRVKRVRSYQAGGLPTIAEHFGSTGRVATELPRR